MEQVAANDWYAVLSYIFYIILQEREMGLRLNIIIIAEGAIDMDGNAITASMIKDVGSFIMFDWLIIA